MSFEVCVHGEFSHSSHRPISWSSKEAARAFGVRNRRHLLLTGSAIHHKGIYIKKKIDIRNEIFSNFTAWYILGRIPSVYCDGHLWPKWN